jgi:hypothetical protein
MWQDYSEPRWMKFRAFPVTLGALFVLSVIITSCSEEEPENHSVLKEVIDVQGSCWEDHVGQRDSYAGQIVRWQATDTGKVLTYGFLFKEGKLFEQLVEEVQNPTAYHTPHSLEFVPIEIDTDQPKWSLHGVSKRGEDDKGRTVGYDSTCNLDVVSRGMEIRPPKQFSHPQLPHKP